MFCSCNDRSHPILNHLTKNVVPVVQSLLFYTVNISLFPGIFSSIHKHAVISPILKNKICLDSICPTNYCPISLQQQSSKELPIYTVSNSPILSSTHPTGFLSHHFTETALSRSPVSSMLLKPMINSQTLCYLNYHLTQLITQSTIHLLHLVSGTPHCPGFPPTSFMCSFSDSNAGSSFSPKLVLVGVPRLNPWSSFPLPWQPYSVSWFLNVIYLPTAPKPLSPAWSFLMNQRFAFILVYLISSIAYLIDITHLTCQKLNSWSITKYLFFSFLLTYGKHSFPSQGKQTKVPCKIPHPDEVHIDVPIHSLPTWNKQTSAINIYTQIIMVDWEQIIAINTPIQERKDLEIHSHQSSLQLWNFVEWALWSSLPWLDPDSSPW